MGLWACEGTVSGFCDSWGCRQNLEAVRAKYIFKAVWNFERELYCVRKQQQALRK